MIARYKKIRRSGVGHCQKVIIGRIGGCGGDRKTLQKCRKGSYLVDEAGGQDRVYAFTNLGIAGYPHHSVELICGCQKVESAAAPKNDQMRG